MEKAKEGQVPRAGSGARVWAREVRPPQGAPPIDSSPQKADFPAGIPECGTDALRFGLCAYTSQGMASKTSRPSPFPFPTVGTSREGEW